MAQTTQSVAVGTTDWVDLGAGPMVPDGDQMGKCWSKPKPTKLLTGELARTLDEQVSNLGAKR
jgi:hypothetical protein